MKFSIFISLYFVVMVAAARGVYQRPNAFIDQVFEHQKPTTKFVWLTKDIKTKTQQILGHPYQKLRIKYWQKGNLTAWILNEIGKEEPITVGILVESQTSKSPKSSKIKLLKVLEYRESRGDEVRHEFFTSQFKNISLNAQSKLDQSVDGITGATLSVNALKRLSRLALFLTGSIHHGKEGSNASIE